MTGWIIVLCWITMAIIFVAFGRLCQSKTLLGVGAVMMLMTAMVNDVSW